MKRQVLNLSIFLLAAVLGCGGPKADKPAAAGAPATTDTTAKTPPQLPDDVQSVADIVHQDPAAAAGGAGEGNPLPPEANAGAVAASGEFVAAVRSELVSRIPGRVGKVFVDEGDRVHRGQPVLAIESEYLALELKRAAADVTRAQAAAADARRDFDRKKELLGNNSVSKAAYDRSQSAYEGAQAEVESMVAARDLARQRLADAVVRSPLDGAVAERRADVGERLGDNTVAFVLVQTSPLKLRFQLPERYLSSLRLGQPVRAEVDPYPGESFGGRVSQIGQVVDSQSRTVTVETEFANRDGRLSPGLFARVEIDLGSGTKVRAPGDRQGR